MGIFWILFIVVSIAGIAICQIFKFIAEIVLYAIIVLILLFALFFFGLSHENKKDKGNEQASEKSPETDTSGIADRKAKKTAFALFSAPANKRRAARVNAEYQKEKEAADNAGKTTWQMPYYRCPPLEAIKRLFSKYLRFSGRSSRSEYWWADLLIAAVDLALLIIDKTILGRNGSLLDVIWILAIFVPALAVSVRRLHDSDKSGWWMLLPVALTAFSAATVVIASFTTRISIGTLLLNTGHVGSGIAIAVYVAGIIDVIATVFWIVLMTLAPNPYGARFDSPDQLA
ncbi:DUF805 domain-containing protein [Bifidobacterium sp. ESL0745]|uniref:DUF805 domain-containing protein n=1 Tax=Bifidobacterium sp. ESL0745 TaxID=2983226 RepID=UPI0023F89E3A|nr:DUF805 domain-containing protein [Bifidobacterium sp. ESL0745]MDF7665644.1 DUF805 domain-containing protein [Bifidobacterium sp. ESL0745]